MGIVTRTTYLEYIKSPRRLNIDFSVCTSPMIASQLARYPLLLDELLIQTPFLTKQATDAYRDELRQYLLRVPEDDEEQQLRRCVSWNRRSC
ncbi:hypothetical protein ACNKHP_08125 [Shigella boydii]